VRFIEQAFPPRRNLEQRYIHGKTKRNQEMNIFKATIAPEVSLKIIDCTNNLNL